MHHLKDSIKKNVKHKLYIVKPNLNNLFAFLVIFEI